MSDCTVLYLFATPYTTTECDVMLEKESTRSQIMVGISYTHGIPAIADTTMHVSSLDYGGLLHPSRCIADVSNLLYTFVTTFIII